MNSSFEEIYAQITKMIQTRDLEKAYSLIDELFKKVTLIDEKVYGFLLKINVLTLLNKSDEVLKAYDEFINNSNDVEDINLLKYVAQSYYNKALLLSKENQDLAINSYDELTKRFENNENYQIQEFIVKSLINKASILLDKNEFEEAIKTYDEIYNKYINFDGEILKQVAISLHNKAIVLGQLGKESELFSLCDLIIDKFSNINDEIIINILSTAEVIKDKDRHQNSW